MYLVGMSYLDIFLELLLLDLKVIQVSDLYKTSTHVPPCDFYVVIEIMYQNIIYSVSEIILDVNYFFHNVEHVSLNQISHSINVSHVGK